MKQKSLFDICVCKKTSPEELLQWLGFERDCYVIDLGDRYLRVLAHRDAVQFSEPKKRLIDGLIPQPKLLSCTGCLSGKLF